MRPLPSGRAGGRDLGRPSGAAMSSGVALRPVLKLAFWPRKLRGREAGKRVGGGPPQAVEAAVLCLWVGQEGEAGHQPTV